MTSLAMTISFWLFMLATIATILIGLLYATRRTVMPYHLDALETSWDEVDGKYQFLLKALSNGGGFFGLANGLFMLVILLIPFRQGEMGRLCRWSYWPSRLFTAWFYSTCRKE